jgi:uncharacterized protein YecT (DUF1311 family)
MRVLSAIVLFMILIWAVSAFNSGNFSSPTISANQHLRSEDGVADADWHRVERSSGEVAAIIDLSTIAHDPDGNAHARLCIVENGACPVGYRQRWFFNCRDHSYSWIDTDVLPQFPHEMTRAERGSVADRLAALACASNNSGTANNRTAKESASSPQPIAASPMDNIIVPRGVEKPSFDCAQAKSAAATLICADAELATLDGELGVAFRKRKAQIPGSDQSKLVAEQLAWIRDRNARCELNGKNGAATAALASAKPCMATAIQERIGFFSQAESSNADAAMGAATAPVATLAQSEINALRARLMALWAPPPEVNRNPGKFVITISIKLTRDRRLAGTPVVLTNGDGTLFAAARDSALQAVIKAQPYDMLLDANYGAWKEIEFSFDPREVAQIVVIPLTAPPPARSSFLRWRDGYMDHGQLVKADWRTIVADNGAVTAVDMKSISYLVRGGAYMVAYSVEADIFDPSNLKNFTFDCQGHFSVLSAATGGISPMMYAPPRSVAAQIGALACAGTR